jgi:hypothetical protein
MERERTGVKQHRRRARDRAASLPWPLPQPGPRKGPRASPACLPRPACAPTRRARAALGGHPTAPELAASPLFLASCAGIGARAPRPVRRALPSVPVFFVRRAGRPLCAYAVPRHARHRHRPPSAARQAGSLQRRAAAAGPRPPGAAPRRLAGLPKRTAPWDRRRALAGSNAQPLHLRRASHAPTDALRHAALAADPSAAHALTLAGLASLSTVWGCAAAACPQAAPPPPLNSLSSTPPARPCASPQFREPSLAHAAGSWETWARRPATAAAKAARASNPCLERAARTPPIPCSAQAQLLPARGSRTCNCCLRVLERPPPFLDIQRFFCCALKRA